MTEYEDTDLAQLAEALTGDLPIGARKVINAALANGWTLNAPGMTVALRLNHPTDDLAAPIYICWAVKKTPSGKVGFTFSGSSTSTLVPLRPAEVLEYLEDPTVAYTLAEEASAEMDKRMKDPPWDERKTEVENLKAKLGAEVIGIEVEGRGAPRKSFQQIMDAQKTAMEASSKPTGGLRVAL